MIRCCRSFYFGASRSKIFQHKILWRHLH